jgi:transposase InsO family protein
VNVREVLNAILYVLSTGLPMAGAAEGPAPKSTARPQAAGAGCGLKANHKRVMKVSGPLLDRHAGGVERRHDGRIAVDERNRRWCFGGFEIGCDNGERVRVAFALDCFDRPAMSFFAATDGISGSDCAT